MTDGDMGPEWRLAAEVLRQALEDAQAHSGQCGLTIWDIQEARRFCTDARGVWAEARGDWCEAAGIHPDVVRTAVSRLSGASA